MMKKHAGAPFRSDHYHHGDLPAALVAATDHILAAEGLAGFSLRAAARLAGVSIAAPTHHFGSAAGLLSEVAALGFDELRKHLDLGSSRARPARRMRMQGLGYVRFALAFPGRFQLMFRRELLDQDNPRLKASADAALAQLERTVRDLRGMPDGIALDAPGRAALVGAWSLVHGFAHLAIDGKLDGPFGAPAHDELLERVLPPILLMQWPD